MHKNHVPGTSTVTLIGFSGRMRAGKSHTANTVKGILERMGYSVEIIPFARPLKDLALSMGWNGLKDAKGRRLLQLLGTECGRNCIDPHIWLDHHAKLVLASRAMVVLVDDVRFPNEANYILGQRGSVVEVVGPKQPVKTILKRYLGLEHASEKPLADNMITHYVGNDYLNRDPSNDWYTTETETSLRELIHDIGLPSYEGITQGSNS